MPNKTSVLSPQGEPARKLFRLLCKAAGVDHLHVRSIECHVDNDRMIPKFVIETLATIEVIEPALQTESV